MRKSGKPNSGELVICRITKIYPNSAFAQLIEYKKSGMIHVSEVAKRWVKNIREFLKENQYVVCRVLRVDDQISLSVKRVRREEAARKLNEFKRERRAEKMLELAGRVLKKSLDHAYNEIGYKLQDEFGSLAKAFETAVKNPVLLKEKGIPKKWADALTETARKTYIEKTYEVRAVLKLICYQPNGIDIIKKALAQAKGFEIKYTSAPNYLMVGKGKSYRDVQASVQKTAQDIVDEVNSKKGEAGFELVK